MKTEKQTSRQIALQWWNNLPHYSHESPKSKESLFNKYFVNGHWFTPAMFFNELTGMEIEAIWKEETSHIDPSDIKSAYAMQVKEGKPQFDEEQFTSLVLNMSEEQQIKAFDMLPKVVYLISYLYIVIFISLVVLNHFGVNVGIDIFTNGNILNLLIALFIYFDIKSTVKKS